jgi:hypothetical protein
LGAAAVLGHPWLAGLDCGALLRMEPGEAGLMAPVRCSHLTPLGHRPAVLGIFLRIVCVSYEIEASWVIGLPWLKFPYASPVCRTRLRRAPAPAQPWVPELSSHVDTRYFSAAAAPRPIPGVRDYEDGGGADEVAKE